MSLQQYDNLLIRTGEFTPSCRHLLVRFGRISDDRSGIALRECSCPSCVARLKEPVDRFESHADDEALADLPFLERR